MTQYRKEERGVVHRDTTHIYRETTRREKLQNNTIRLELSLAKPQRQHSRHTRTVILTQICVGCNRIKGEIENLQTPIQSRYLDLSTTHIIYTAAPSHTVCYIVPH